MSSSININSVNLRDARKAVMHALGRGVVPFVCSSPGVGKSAMFASIANEYNLLLLDNRVSTMEPPDLNGLPDFKTCPVTNERYAVYAPFLDMFPTEDTPLPPGKDGWLLLFDEANHADESMQKALYKVILDRKIGKHKLHPNLVIGMAGNLSTDNALTEKLSTALNSRVVFMEVEPDYKTWREDFAMPKGIDFRIQAYLDRFNSRFHTFDPTNPQQKSYACARTWETVHKLIDGETSIGWMLQLIAGTIDQATAVEFVKFCEVVAELPDPSDIFNDPGNAPIPANSELQWATVAMLMNKVSKDQVVSIYDYIKRMPMTMQFLYLQNMSMKHRSLNSDPAFTAALLSLVSYGS